MTFPMGVDPLTLNVLHQLLYLPSHLHVIADGRTNLLQTSRDVGGRQQWQIQDTANVIDVVAVLVMFFVFLRFWTFLRV